MCGKPEVRIGALGDSGLHNFGELHGEFFETLWCPPRLNDAIQPVGRDRLGAEVCSENATHNCRHRVRVAPERDGFYNRGSQVSGVLCDK